MPELAEHMYCSEQISIPPTFPYLLRQYAKAAIRTQPSDLLRWSAAYFRCLAVNIPPPVKPRLEYPIPRDHCGLTPGWLKALLCQLPNTQTVHFKILWDRWTGACLKHENLIEILCLAGFDDPFSLPFLRFIAICAAHLTDNLTQTMIMVCEILTEEPEGGSAMIPLVIFLDLYRFLASIDASEVQTLKNLYFTDEMLGLCPESEEQIDKEVEEEAPPEAPEEEAEPEEVAEEAQEAPPPEIDLDVVVSCPDLQADDFEPGDLENYEKQLEEEESAEGEDKPTDAAEPDATSQAKPEEDLNADTSAVSDVSAPAAVESGEKLPGDEQSDEAAPPPEEEEEPPLGEETEEVQSRDTLIGFPGQGEKQEEEDEERVKSDLERLKAAQEQEVQDQGEEGAPIEDEEIEMFKKYLYAEQVPITQHLEQYADMQSEVMSAQREEASAEQVALFEEEEEPIKIYEEVQVEAVPGIGGIVPEHLMEAVVNYMKEMAERQHGMVMPRNIRHYRCPPLEVLPL